MENFSPIQILSNLDRLTGRSLQENPSKRTLDFKRTDLYFLTSSNEKHQITRITERMTENKPYYSKHYIGYYKITGYGIHVDHLHELFRRAKITGVDFGILKYNNKFLEDTDFWFSELHPYLFLAFYKEANWTPIAEWVATEDFVWDKHQAMLLFTGSDKTMSLSFGKDSCHENVHIGLTAYNMDTFCFQYIKNELLLEYTGKDEQTMENLRQLATGLGIVLQCIPTGGLRFQKEHKESEDIWKTLLHYLDTVPDLTYQISYLTSAILF